MPSQPRERPIVFMPEMVRAIRDGRKTVTRRLVKSPSDYIFSLDDVVWEDNRWWACAPKDSGRRETFRCPFGELRDRLWAKERWSVRQRSSGCPSGDDYFIEVEYSDGGRRQFDLEEIPEAWTIPNRNINASPLFMPRWASRLTLEVTNVRAERLQDITDEEAKAEGVSLEIPALIDGNPGTYVATDHREAFELAWERINGKRAPWSSNPWVWAISFRKLDG